jgi:hypothetical protein
VRLALDGADLERAFGHPVDAVTVEPLDPERRLHSITGGVFRVRAGDESLVVKVLRRSDEFTADGLWGGADDVDHRNYWKREWLAFDSGLLDSLPGELRAPYCRLTSQPDDDECWIWMEDLAGRTGPTLLLDDYDAVARALGTTQGAYATGGAPLPEHPWLSRDWLAGWVALTAPFVEAAADPDRWRDPRLAPFHVSNARALALWQARDELLRVAASAPPTLVHWDFWPTNLYVDATGPVAIDWSQVGLAGLAHDLDQLVLDPVWMHVRPAEDLAELQRRVIPAYAAGLRAAGCEVSDAEVFRWYAAVAAARYAWLAGNWPRLLADPESVRAQERRLGRPIDSIVAAKAMVVRHAVELGEGLIESTA